MEHDCTTDLKCWMKFKIALVFQKRPIWNLKWSQHCELQIANYCKMVENIFRIFLEMQFFFKFQIAIFQNISTPKNPINLKFRMKFQFAMFEIGWFTNLKFLLDIKTTTPGPLLLTDLALQGLPHSHSWSRHVYIMKIVELRRCLIKNIDRSKEKYLVTFTRCCK